MTKYKHIFFDLDRTLWDFDYNSKKTLKDIYNYLNLNNYGIKNFKLFISVYKKLRFMDNNQIQALPFLIITFAILISGLTVIFN